VQALAVEPWIPEVVYAGTRECGLFKSVDSGVTWYPITHGLDQTYVHAVAINPLNPNIIYASIGLVSVSEGGYCFIYLSSNGGSTWLRIQSGLPKDTNFVGIVPDPSHINTFYVHSSLAPGGEGKGVYKTTTNGATWLGVSYGLGDLNVISMVIDPNNTQVLYAGTYNGGIYKTINGGTSWSAANNGLPSHATVSSIAIDPKYNNVIYIATESGLFKTVGGGNVWSAINNPPSLVRIVAIDPIYSNTLYAGTATEGAFKSEDSGETWSAINTGMTSKTSLSLRISHLLSTELYLGTSQGGVFKSTNKGSNWSAVNSGIQCSYASCMAIDPITSSTLYAGLHGGGILKSSDGGVSWSAINIGLPSFPVTESLIVDPVHSNTLYTGIDLEGVYKSMDGGQTWLSANVGLTNFKVRTLAIDTIDTDVVFAGTFGSAYRSTDGGNSWISINFGLPTTPFVEALVVNPITPTITYVSILSEGVFKSMDSGDVWFAAYNGLPSSPYINILAIDPTNTNLLYANDKNMGLYFTTDGGNIWQALQNDLPKPVEIESLAIDPEQTETLFAGTASQGVFVSLNRGVNWAAINEGLPLIIASGTYPPVPVMGIDPTLERAIYIGTESRGFYKLDQYGDDSDSGDGSSGSGCSWICVFNTASYGSFLYPHLSSVREFRDNRLLECAIGAGLVAIYYIISPHITGYLKRYPFLIGGVRWVLCPVVMTIAYPRTAVCLLLSVLVLYILCRRKRLKKNSSKKCNEKAPPHLETGLDGLRDDQV